MGNNGNMNRRVFCFWPALVLAALGCGCGDRSPENGLIPDQEIEADLEAEIIQALQGFQPGDRRRLEEIGSPAVPLIIARIFEIHRQQPGRQDPVWADTSNLTVLLGDIGDPRAQPALQYLVSEVRYRNNRRYAAHALVQLNDPAAIPALRRAFDEERGYWRAGDQRGPDFGWGVAGNYTAQMLEVLGDALVHFGEDPGDYPTPWRDFHGQMPGR